MLHLSLNYQVLWLSTAVTATAATSRLWSVVTESESGSAAIGRRRPVCGRSPGAAHRFLIIILKLGMYKHVWMYGAYLFAFFATFCLSPSPSLS